MMTPCTVSGIACAPAPCSTTVRASSSRKNGLPSPRCRIARRHLGGEALSPATESISSRAVAGAERRQRDLRHVRAIHPGRAVAGPVGRHQQDPGRDAAARPASPETPPTCDRSSACPRRRSPAAAGRGLQEQQAQRVERARLDRLRAQRLERGRARRRCRSDGAATRPRRPAARCRARPARWPRESPPAHRSSITPQCARSRSTSGRYGTRLPYDTQRPSSMRHRLGRAAIARVDSYTSRDLPMPGSPTMLTTWPLPASACASRPSSSELRARGRRTAPSVRVPPAATAARRPEPGDAKRGCPPTCPAGSVLHVPSTARSVASLIRIAPGSANCCEQVGRAGAHRPRRRTRRARDRSRG